MKFSELRTYLRGFLSRLVWIQGWSTDPPRALHKVYDDKKYPSNVAFEAPVRELYEPIENSSFSLGQRTVSLVAPYVIQYRFPATLKYLELPLTQLTALYTNVVTEWLVSGRGNGQETDIFDVGIPEIVDSPIVVSNIEGVNSDWLVSLFFEFQVRCYFEPERVSDIQPDEFTPPEEEVITPVEINWGLYRSKKGDLGDKADSYLTSEGEVILPD